jgi:hypothetical protein
MRLGAGLPRREGLRRRASAWKGARRLRVDLCMLLAKVRDGIERVANIIRRDRGARRRRRAGWRRRAGLHWGAGSRRTARLHRRALEGNVDRRLRLILCMMLVRVRDGIEAVAHIIHRDVGDFVVRDLPVVVVHFVVSGGRLKCRSVFIIVLVGCIFFALFSLSLKAGLKNDAVKH